MAKKKKGPIKVCFTAVLLIIILIMLVFAFIFIIPIYSEKKTSTRLDIYLEPDNNGNYEIIVPLIFQMDSQEPFFKISSPRYSEGEFELSQVNTPYGLGLKINATGPVRLEFRAELDENLGYSLGVDSPNQPVNGSSQGICWIYFNSTEVNEISIGYYCRNGGSNRWYSIIGMAVHIGDYFSTLDIVIDEKIDNNGWNQYEITTERKD